MFLSAVFAAFSRLLYLSLGVGTQSQFPPPLPQKQESAYFEILANGEEPQKSEARSQLILHNLRLVSHIVRKYYGTAKDQEDLVSIGCIGLIKAVDTYHSDSGIRFATYGAKCVQNEILMQFRREKHAKNEISIHETIDVDRDGNPLTYMDVIASDESMTDEVDSELLCKQALALVRQKLDEREREILTLRYGLGNEEALSQREVAARLGISRSYVSRIEKGALEKLRSEMHV